MDSLGPQYIKDRWGTSLARAHHKTAGFLSRWEEGGREGCREGAGRGQGGGSDMLGAWGAGKGAGRWFGVQGREGCREVQGGAGRCREVQGGGSGCREVRGCRDVRGVQ